MEMTQDDAKGDVYLTTLGVVYMYIYIYIMWNSILVSSELGRIWTDAIVAWFDILQRHLFGRPEENYDDTFIRLVTLQDEFDTMTFRIQKISASCRNAACGVCMKCITKCKGCRHTSCVHRHKHTSTWLYVKWCVILSSECILILRGLRKC